MIYITTAPNDAELMPYFPPGTAQFYPLYYGDAACVGAPVNGTGTLWSGERKKLGDMLSCIRSGRHIEQVRRAYQAGWNKQTLIVQLDQPIRKGIGGLLEVRQGKSWVAHNSTGREFSYNEFADYLNEIYWLGGVQVIMTRSTKQSAEAIYDVHRVLSKPPEAHHILDQFYSAPIPRVSLLGVPSLIRRMSKELPGIGWELSERVEAKFGTVREMAAGSDDAWLDIEGIGQRTLDRIKEQPTW